MGHDQWAPVNSLAVIVNAQSAMNCYWPMPFRKRARITFTNESEKDLTLFTYQITYAKAPIADNTGYFHAQWRRTTTERFRPPAQRFWTG